MKITFSGGEQPQTLYYFKTDLVGGGNSAFLRWCAARGPGLSLLKAASFLLHGDGFSGVRNFLLQHSRVIIQDDSGIPLRDFPERLESELLWPLRCRITRNSRNIISLIWLRSSRKTRRLQRSVLPSAIIGKKMTAFSCSPRAKLYRRSRPRSSRKKCASENEFSRSFRLSNSHLTVSLTLVPKLRVWQRFNS